MGREMELNVTVNTSEVVLPSLPTDSSPLFLSQIDEVVAYMVDTVYFYPASSSSSSGDVVSKLREAMGSILVPYHFMAGRLRLSLPPDMRLEIDCNRTGAIYVAASANLRMDELGDITHPNPQFRKLIPPSDAQKLCDTPLLMMQVTTFKCGGFAVGFSMNHAIFDGIGALEFVANFCAVARGEGLLVEPKPDRTCLKPRDPLQIKFEHCEFIKQCDILKEGHSFTTSDNLDSGLSSLSLSAKPEIYKIFPLTDDMIASLKKKALEEEIENGRKLSKCSSFDVIAAHIWQCRTKAISMDTASPSKMLFAVDIRNRLVPPLCKGFTGNAVFSAFASVGAGELQERGLAFAVRKVQEAAEGITDEYLRSAIDWGSIHRGIPNLPGGIFLSAWWKLPFDLMDFGWGKPLYAGPIVNAMVEFVLLLSNGTRNGLNVYLALQPQHMDQFEKLVYQF